VLVIHQGRLLFDGDLSGLVRRFASHKTIVLDLEDDTVHDLRPYGEVVAWEEGRVQLRVAKAQAASVTARLLADLPIADLTVEDPPIEEVIDHIFVHQTVHEVL
jgi:ABC-2 type transport system ATP-binding protein